MSDDPFDWQPTQSAVAELLRRFDLGEWDRTSFPGLVLALLGGAGLESVSIADGITGGIDAGQTIFRWPAVQSIVFRAQMLGSQAVCARQAAATATFSVQKNNSQFGTMVFSAATTPATFTGSKTLFAPGDVLTIIAPTPADTTLEGIAWNLLAKRASLA